MKFKRFLLILLLGLFIVSFTACDNNDNPDKKDDPVVDDQDDKKDDQKDPEQKDPEEKDKEHVHAYTVKSLDEKYLSSSATCTSGSIYYYSCECGEAGTQVFEANDVKGHKLAIGDSFYTSKEVVGVIMPEGVVRVFFTCSECFEEVYVDCSVASHEHICHEATSNSENTHEGTCAICDAKFTENCLYNDLNECIYCENEKAPTYLDALWTMQQDETKVEVITQNEVKSYYYNKGNEVYDNITVTTRDVTYNSGIGCTLTKTTNKFQYELDTDNYYLQDRTEIGTYGWYPVSFKISKCVDAVGATYYYKFANGNIGIWFTCNGECTTDSYHEYNEKGQLLVFKQLTHIDDDNKVLRIYTYSYGKQWDGK